MTPPLENGELLIDGGLLNNRPIDIMRERVAGTTIAVDVSVADEYQVKCEELPSASEYLRTSLLRRKQRPLDVATLDRVMIKATALGSSRLAGQVKLGANLYLNPPVNEFDLLAWDRFHDIVRAGYEYTRNRLEEWLPATSTWCAPRGSSTPGCAAPTARPGVEPDARESIVVFGGEPRVRALDGSGPPRPVSRGPRRGGRSRRRTRRARRPPSAAG